LHYVHDPGPRARIEQLTREAEWTQSADDRFRDELAEWTPLPGSMRRDGVPASAYSAGRGVHPDTIAARDFDSGRGIGRLGAGTPSRGLLAILTTAGDRQRDWLQAGMSLGAVLTTAAAQWVFAALHSQVIEVAPLRAELRRELVTAAYPQLVLQFGHASQAPTTPRRAASEITGTPMTAGDVEIRPPAEIDRERCLELVSGEQIGRLAWTDGEGRVQIVPVNYRVDDGNLYFSSAVGAKLEAARARRAVAFEVDEVELALHAGWSVVIHGTLSEVTDPEDRQRLAEQVVAWGAAGTRLLRVRPEQVEGRRLPVRPGGVAHLGR
jgi:nitroimidazol reductase NimA-like FMN-containing flavoprotein (pyridoxamine 5'-phosphate oxidase superfamily)